MTAESQVSQRLVISGWTLCRSYAVGICNYERSINSGDAVAVCSGESCSLTPNENLLQQRPHDKITLSRSFRSSCARNVLFKNRLNFTVTIAYAAIQINPYTNDLIGSSIKCKLLRSDQNQP